MKDITLKTATADSIIRCGAGAFDKYASAYKNRQIFLVTDENVNAIYNALLTRTFGKYHGIVLPAGENSKTPENLLKILGAMLDSGMRRNCCVIAFGGGVVGDIAGLAASLYMRGVRLIQIPTTLLAQVDSSVGGKTAVDMGGVKNVVGSFYQPEEVIADPRFLETLPHREIVCGLGEIIKYGALDKDIYISLCENADNLKNLGYLGEIAYGCIAHKARVVEKDEHDLSGARKALNLGHTTGHAFELYYGGKSHGEYVLIGMYYELYIARKLGICKGKYAENIKNLILAVLGGIPRLERIEEAAAFAVHDKKNDDERISLIAPQSEGESAEIKLAFGEYVKYLGQCSEEVGGVR